MRYVIVTNGKIKRVTKTLKEALTSSVFRPFGGSQIYEVDYDTITNEPTAARAL